MALSSPASPGAPSSGDAAAAAFDGVVAPAATSESTGSGVGLAGKTFDSFTDPNGLIDNYNAVTTTTTGTCTWSGSGLGAYTPTDADGDSGTLALQARDSSNNVLATAYHTYDRAPAGASAWSQDELQTWTNVTSGPVDLTGDGTGTTASGVVSGRTVAIEILSTLTTLGGTCEVNATNGIDIAGTGTNKNRFLCIDGPAAIDENGLVALVVCVKSVVLGDNGANFSVWVSDDPLTYKGTPAWQFFATRTAAGVADHHTRIWDNTSSTTSTAAADTTLETNYRVAFVFHNHRCSLYVDTGTTLPASPLDVGGKFSNVDMGSNNETPQTTAHATWGNLSWGVQVKSNGAGGVSLNIVDSAWYTADLS